MRILGSAVTALLLTAGSAVAAPWSTPASIPGASDAAPLLAEDAAGPRAVYWETLSLTPGTTPISAFVSALGPGLQPAPAALLSPTVNPGEALAYGSGRVALAETQTGVATGPLGGPLIVHPLTPDVLALAGDAAGDLAVLTEPCGARFAGCDATTPSVVIGRRGHALGRPIRLDPRRGRAYDAGLAMDAHGRILVAWDRGGAIYARFVSTHGKLSPIQRLASEHGPPRFDVALSNDGRAGVGWGTQTVDEGDATSPFRATLSLAGSSGRFGRARTLGTVPVTGVGRYIPYRGLAVRLPAGQPGLAAWSGYDGAHYVVRAASITGTRVGGAQTVSPAATDTVLADAAEGGQGQAAILLLPGRAGNDPRPRTGTTTAAGLLAVTRATGRNSFGGPEQILPGPAFVDGASVGIDAATGSVFATWRDVGSPIGWSVRTPLG